MNPAVMTITHSVAFGPAIYSMRMVLVVMTHTITADMPGQAFHTNCFLPYFDLHEGG